MEDFGGHHKDARLGCHFYITRQKTYVPTECAPEISEFLVGESLDGTGVDSTGSTAFAHGAGILGHDCLASRGVSSYKDGLVIL